MKLLAKNEVKPKAILDIPKSPVLKWPTILFSLGLLALTTGARPHAAEATARDSRSLTAVINALKAYQQNGEKLSLIKALKILGVPKNEIMSEDKRITKLNEIKGFGRRYGYIKNWTIDGGVDIKTIEIRLNNNSDKVAIIIMDVNSMKCYPAKSIIALDKHPGIFPELEDGPPALYYVQKFRNGKYSVASTELIRKSNSPCVLSVSFSFN